MLVNVDVTKQEDLTPATTKAVLNAFSKGTKPKTGPQSGRHTSENSAGLTALTSKASPLYFVSYLYVSLTMTLCSHMAQGSIVNQVSNSASHRREWGEYRRSHNTTCRVMGAKTRLYEQ